MAWENLTVAIGKFPINEKRNIERALNIQPIIYESLVKDLPNFPVRDIQELSLHLAAVAVSG